MSDSSLRGFRTHALAAATAAVLSASMFAAPAFAGQVFTGGLQSAASHDRFIVKYRAGSTERADVGLAKAALTRIAAAGAGGKAVALGHLRRLAVGADVVLSNRKLDRVEAESLMRQIATDPNVEYVQVDALMQPLMTPNDTRYTEQ